jgi:hypothetical protein
MSAAANIHCVPEDATVPFYGNQLEAAENIVSIYKKGIVCHVLLQANVQSGKTGAYNATIRQMHIEGLVDRTYVLCGSSETVLREQAELDAIHYNAEYVADGTLSVLFRTAFKRGRLFTDAGRVLLVIDESHMDQGNDMQLDMFLQKHGLDMAGTTEFMRDNQIYILSVSATPYAEVASVPHALSRHKERVLLSPGPGYYGPGNYLKDGNVFPAFDIATHPEEFVALLRAPRNKKKYCLIRVNDKKERSRMEAIAQRLGIQYRDYNGRTQTIAITAAEALQLNKKRGGKRQIKSLEDVPSVTTLVFLKQRLRAGKVVPKQHIGFVWEGAAKATTDALVQGLFGRMCGYSVPAEPPHIYLPPASLEKRADRVVAFSEIERHELSLRNESKWPLVIPTKGLYLTKSRSSKRPPNGRVQCPPLRLPGLLREVSDGSTAFGAIGEMNLKRNLLTYLSTHRDPIRAHAGMTAEQQEEICNLLDLYERDGAFSPSGHGILWPAPMGEAQRPVVHIRHSTGQVDYFEGLAKAAAANTIHEENIDGCDPINFCAVYDGYLGREAVVGDVFVVFYTNARATLRTRPLKHRIPAPHPCAFTLHNKKVGDMAFATASLTLTDHIYDMPRAFAGQMRHVLELWRGHMDGDATKPILDTRISSYRGRMRFSREAYGSRSWEDGQFAEILSGLEVAYRCRFTFKGMSAHPAVFYVESITWEEI